MKYPVFLAIFVLGLILFACEPPMSLSMSEAKFETFKAFGIFKDTSEVGLVQISQDTQNHWFVTYNKVQTDPAIYFFKAERSHTHNHQISLRHKQEAIVEKLVFEDVTQDGELELLVYLHYDYDLSFQGKEVIVYQNPFDSAATEIFEFAYEQIWEQTESFDSTYGIPSNKKRIENKAVLTFFEGKIMIKGIVKGKKHHLVEYEWDKKDDAFVLIIDEDLHEESEENEKGLVSNKMKGNKVLMPVEAHEPDCSAFVLEDADGRVLKTSKKMQDALRCSKVAALSDDGNYLVYTDTEKDALMLYDFNLSKNTMLLEGFEAKEGVSKPVWYKAKGKYYIGFVAVDLDEFEFQSRIYIFKYDASKKQWTEKKHDLRMVFDCDFDGFCTPQEDYDFRFSPSGNFLFRIRESGHSIDDFGVLNI